MYDVPLIRLLRYYHAAIWSNGAWTRLPVEKEKVKSIDSMFQEVASKLNEEEDYGY
jgi:hypothetical protein